MEATSVHTLNDITAYQEVNIAHLLNDTWLHNSGSHRLGFRFQGDLKTLAGMRMEKEVET